MSASLAEYRTCLNCGYALLSFDGKVWVHDWDDSEYCDATESTRAVPVEGEDQ